jgi:hypothetical protein
MFNMLRNGGAAYMEFVSNSIKRHRFFGKQIDDPPPVWIGYRLENIPCYFDRHNM